MIHVIEYTEPEPKPQDKPVNKESAPTDRDWLKFEEVGGRSLRRRKINQVHEDYHGQRVTGDDTNSWMTDWSPKTYNPNEI